MSDSRPTSTRRDRLRPVEFIVISAVAAVFIGLIVLLSTRELVLALVFAGIAFIVCLVVIAMLILAVKPNDDTPPTYPVLGDPSLPHKGEPHKGEPQTGEPGSAEPDGSRQSD